VDAVDTAQVVRHFHINRISVGLFSQTQVGLFLERWKRKITFDERDKCFDIHISATCLRFISTNSAPPPPFPTEYISQWRVYLVLKCRWGKIKLFTFVANKKHFSELWICLLVYKAFFSFSSFLSVFLSLFPFCRLYFLLTFSFALLSPFHSAFRSVCPSFFLCYVPSVFSSLGPLDYRSLCFFHSVILSSLGRPLFHWLFIPSVFPFLSLVPSFFRSFFSGSFFFLY
jgi:hypothetical protein